MTKREADGNPDADAGADGQKEEVGVEFLSWLGKKLPTPLLRLIVSLIRYVILFPSGSHIPPFEVLLLNASEIQLGSDGL
jgi:hypothetical protein